MTSSSFNSNNQPLVRRYYTSAPSTSFANAVMQPDNTLLANDTNNAIIVNTVSYNPQEIMLEPGQVQIFDVTPNGQPEAILGTGPTGVEAFKIVQRRDDSADSAILSPRPLEISYAIPTKAPMRLVTRNCRIDKNASWVIGANDGTPGALIPVENNEYTMALTFRGNIAQQLNARNHNSIRPTMPVDTTFTQLGLATVVEQRDYIMQGLAYNANRYSRVFPGSGSQPYVVFAVESNPSGSNTALSSIVPGSSVPFLYQNGNTSHPVSVTFTNGMYEAVVDAIASTHFAGTDEIIPVSPASIGSNFNGGAVDKLLIIALDRVNAHFDYKKQTKYNMRIGMFGGNVNLNVSQISTPLEMIGDFRNMYLDYRRYAELNKKYFVQEPHEMAIQYDLDFDRNTPYFTIELEWMNYRASTGQMNGEFPHLETIAIPCCDEALRTAWEGLLNNFFTQLPNLSVDPSSDLYDAATNTFNLDAVASVPCDAIYQNPFSV